MSVRSRARALPQSRRFCRVIFAFGGLALVHMLTGCLLDSQRPPLTGIPSGYGAGQGDSAPPALDWWRGFNSAELTGLIEEAQTSNFNIGAAIARIMQADALAKLAGAPLLPTLVLDANATRLRPAGGPVRENYRAALTAAYEIDFWGKNRAALIAAQETAAATRFAKEVVVLSTIVSVGTAYLQVLVSQDRIRHRAPESRCRDPRSRSDQAAVQCRHCFAARHRAAGKRGGRHTRQHSALRPDRCARTSPCWPCWSGAHRWSVRVKGGSLYSLRIPRVTPGMPSELILQRPDIRQAEANLASAEASVTSARAAFFPSISLTGQGGYENPLLKALFRPESFFFSIATSLTQPLLDGFRLEGQLEVATSQQLELMKLYCQAILAGFGDVEIALIAIADTAERERLQQVVVNSSRQAFNISETAAARGNGRSCHRAADPADILYG